MRLGRKKTGPPAAKNRDGRQVYKLAGGDLDRDGGFRGVDQMTVSRSYSDSVGCSLCLMEDGKQSSLGSTERNVVQTNDMYFIVSFSVALPNNDSQRT